MTVEGDRRRTQQYERESYCSVHLEGEKKKKKDKGNVHFIS